MKFLSLLKNNTHTSSKWAWPSCRHQPRTLSFRDVTNGAVIKTVNSTDLDLLETPESVFTETPASGSFSTVSEDSRCGPPIRGLRSDRFFFEPDETSSILDSKLVASSGSLFLKNSVMLELDSRDPHVDFKKSMEEMVVSLGVKDWQGFEELLFSFLKVNVKSNHGFIVAAFVDLLGSFIASPPCSSPSPPSSSFYSSSCSNRCNKEQVVIREDGASSSSRP